MSRAPSPSLIQLLASAKGRLQLPPRPTRLFNIDKTCRFGFIKYHNFIDAENAIRGFYYRNYEAKYARVWLHTLSVSLNKLTPLQVGHNERLKTLANPNNTNLYLSNLPKNMNEAVCTYSFGHVCFH